MQAGAQEAVGSTRAFRKSFFSHSFEADARRCSERRSVVCFFVGALAEAA